MVSDFFLQSCYQTTIYIFVLKTKLHSHFLTILRRLFSTKKKAMEINILTKKQRQSTEGTKAKED